jgi:hypothetical protein
MLPYCNRRNVGASNIEQTRIGAADSGRLKVQSETFAITPSSQMISFEHFYGVAIREQRESKQSSIMTARTKPRAQNGATPDKAVIADCNDNTTTV